MQQPDSAPRLQALQMEVLPARSEAHSESVLAAPAVRSAQRLALGWRLAPRNSRSGRRSTQSMHTTISVLKISFHPAHPCIR